MSTEAPVPRVDAGTFFNVFNRIEEMEESAIALIPSLSVEQLMEGIARAQALGESAWRIRAAYAEELAQRQMALRGGRGQKAAPGQGVTQALARVASEAHVEVRTIQRDRQILKTFGETGAINDRRLGRGFFEIALGAPDPQAAITFAQQQLDEDESYNTKQFGCYVQALRERALRNEPEDSRKELENLFWLNVPISQEARRAMAELCKRRQLQPGDVVSQVLIDALYWSEQKGKR